MASFVPYFLAALLGANLSLLNYELNCKFLAGFWLAFSVFELVIGMVKLISA